MTIGSSHLSSAIRILLLAACSACLCSSAQAKQKDVVIMTNGDQITGEVKRLQNGLLYVETDYVSGNIGLDWNQVESVQSTATFQVVLINGKRLEGRIERKSGKGTETEDFKIHGVNGEVEVSSAEIATMETKKATFWRQLQGSIDFGYNFTSGNSQSSLNVDTSTAYKAPKWEATTSFDSTFSGQSGASKTNREDAQISFTRYLNRNSFLMSLTEFLHSSQQDLDLRTTLGGGYGRYLKRTTNSSFAWLGGLVYIHEHFGTSAGSPSGQSEEAVVGLQCNYVRFNFGNFNCQALVFPSLTDPGRIRATTNNGLTIKLRNNFHLSFSLWDNFDSRPPATAKKNELGTSMGVGYSF